MKEQTYFDAYYQPGENPVFCYRSGLMVYEEALIGGVFVAQGYNAAGYPLNVLTNCPTRLDPTQFGEPYAFNLEINGVNIGHALEFENFVASEEDSGLHAMIILKSRLLPVEIHVHTLLDGTQMFTRWIRIVNLSDTPLNISRIGLLSGGQYDNLMKKMGKNSKAIGFAVYLDVLERLGKKENEYDYDFIVLKDENTDPALIIKNVEAISENGSNVIVLGKIPEDLRYRGIINLTSKTGEEQ